MPTLADVDAERVPLPASPGASQETEQGSIHGSLPAGIHDKPTSKVAMKSPPTKIRSTPCMARIVRQ
jgi:hypothetical protein